MAYSYERLKQLWVLAGGSADKADIAAAVALAESSGDPNAVSPARAIGLWQILWSNAQGADLTDPLQNAKRAVQMSKNGINWQPWDVMWYPASRARSSAATYKDPRSPALQELKKHGGGMGLPTLGQLGDKAKDAAGNAVDIVTEPIAQALEGAKTEFIKFGTQGLFAVLGLGLVGL